VVPAWLIGALAVLVALTLALTVTLWLQPSEDSVEQATGTARAAAERAVVPLLSYDYQSLDADQRAAHDVITSGYRSRDYDDLFEVIRENAPATQTVVEVEVIASAVVRAGEDRSEILLFVNRPTTNKATTEPVVYKDQVTLTMERVGDEWLVDALSTSPIQQ
jgi:Mce-associated membrane protein